MERSSIQILCAILLSCWLGIGLCLGQERDCLIQSAESFLGVREATGNNDGEEVEMFLSSTGFEKGYAWCGSFMTYVYNSCDINNPKSAWSPNWALKSDAVYTWGDGIKNGRLKSNRGDAFTLYYSSKGRVGHVGMYIYSTPFKVYTIEGNTNQAGSREGDGVYRKVRSWNTIYRITNYIDK